MDTETKLPVVNVSKIKEVLAYIDEDQRRLRMTTFGTVYSDSYAKDHRSAIPPCNTVCCFAGWTLFLSDKEYFNSCLSSSKTVGESKTIYNTLNFELRAAKILGLTEDEAGGIFYDFSNENLRRNINRVLENRGMKERV